MVYLEYKIEDGSVVRIHEYSETPPEVAEGYSVAICNDFIPGDEFRLFITVKAVVDGFAVSYTIMLR